MSVPKNPKEPLDTPSSLGPCDHLRRFDQFTANLAARELFRGGLRLDVEPKVFQMLSLLLQAPGQVVTYAELKTTIWPDVVVELPENANVLASKLREVLGESLSGTRYIFNKRGQGYYFNPKIVVECLALPTANTASLATEPVPTVRRQTLAWPRLKWWLVAASLIPLAVILAAWPRAQLHDLRVQGRDLVALDKNGREMWRYAFSKELMSDQYVSQQKLHMTWIGELAENGQDVMLFVAKPIPTGPSSDTLYCLDGRGKVLWEFSPGRSVTDASGDQMLPPYLVSNVMVIKRNAPSESRIIVSSNHYSGQANQVAFLDINGRLVGEYWHPGHLLHVAQADLEHNGKSLVLLSGVNNGRHEATLVVLDPPAIVGAVSPIVTVDPRLGLLGMAPVKEKAVVFFPRTCVSRDAPYNRVQDLKITEERIRIEVAEGTREFHEPDISYELDYGLNVAATYPGSLAVKTRHELLEREGRLDHPYSRDDWGRIRGAVVVIRP